MAAGSGVCCAAAADRAAASKRRAPRRNPAGVAVRAPRSTPITVPTPRMSRIRSTGKLFKVPPSHSRSPSCTTGGMRRESRCSPAAPVRGHRGPPAVRAPANSWSRREVRLPQILDGDPSAYEFTDRCSIAACTRRPLISDISGNQCSRRSDCAESLSRDVDCFLDWGISRHHGRQPAPMLVPPTQSISTPC